MEKFPLLCTLSALIVFLGAVVGAAGVQTGKSNNPPFGLSSVEQILGSRNAVKTIPGTSGLPELSRNAELKLATRDGTSVAIRGDLLVSF